MFMASPGRMWPIAMLQIASPGRAQSCNRPQLHAPGVCAPAAPGAAKGRLWEHGCVLRDARRQAPDVARRASHAARRLLHAGAKGKGDGGIAHQQNSEASGIMDFLHSAVFATGGLVAHAPMCLFGTKCLCACSALNAWVPVRQLMPVRPFGNKCLGARSAINTCAPVRQ